MRKTVKANGVTVRAYGGTTGVLLAMDVKDGKEKDLLGFAIEREDMDSGKSGFIEGMLPFPNMEHEPGVPIPTNLAPVQKFRWSDYRVFPSRRTPTPSTRSAGRRTSSR